MKTKGWPLPLDLSVSGQIARTWDNSKPSDRDFQLFSRQSASPLVSDKMEERAERSLLFGAAEELPRHVKHAECDVMVT